MYINKLRYYCHKVLPLVYDNSLSYYELLNKVVWKLNEEIDATNQLVGDLAEQVTQIMNEWLADGTLEQIISESVLGYLKQYYVPEEFGAIGDGYSDDTDAFDKAMKAMHDGDIKVLLIPPKTYVIGYTIAIPEGCSVIGLGYKSCIYYSEVNTGFAVGLTNAGNDVTIENLRLEQNRPSGTISMGAQTGCMSFSTLDENMYGKITTLSGMWTRKNTKNLRAVNLWSDNSPYILQTETVEEHSISNVYVNNINAPKSLVSFMSKANSGKLNNIHYHNIKCHYIRADMSGNNIEGACVSNFYCKGMRVSSPGIIVENGVVDCTGETYFTENYGVLLKCGATLKNVQILGDGGNTHEYAISWRYSAESSGLATVIDGCVIMGFKYFSANVTDNDMPNPVFMTNCIVDWVDHDTVSAIQGYITNCKIPNVNFRYPLYINETRRFTINSTSVSFGTGTNVNGYPLKMESDGDRMFIHAVRTIPDGGIILTVNSAFQKYIGEEGKTIPVMLVKADGTFDWTIAEFNSSHQLVIDTTDITLGDYHHYVINDSFKINDLVWSF